ncbi:MAG: glycoside hydrolase family 97 catalytic domain-containing protein [Bacteroidales bacterium]|nr:glycoside hydrolase family 97 catalytic domain-containing protein [Bacteroidales bacterium]
MKLRTILALSLLLAGAVACKKGLSSPDGSLNLSVDSQTLTVTYKGTDVFPEIHLGLIAENADYDTGLTLKKVSGAEKISESYEMLTGKRSHCTNQANEKTLTYVTPKGEELKVIVRLYNDGLAFRYVVPAGTKVTEDRTSYMVKDGVNRWFSSLHTDYENSFPLAKDGKPTPSRRPGGRGSTQWAYPALLEPAPGVFALISEADVRHGDSASSLDNGTAEEYYAVKLTGPTAFHDGLSPWRMAMIGGLDTITESTLVTDLSTPSQIADPSWIKPGLSSWVYWSNNHGSKFFDLDVEFIDLAADMGWPYCLIDWEWPDMEDGSIEELVDYAKEKGIKINLWYNSGTSWVGRGAPQPQDRLNTPENREKEFSWLESLGVTGVKVDFFLPDNADMVDYYLDILEDAAKHHLLVDFHGCTIPRGWQRTWPNMMSMEAVYGAEMYNNGPLMTTLAPSHNATLTFTRNVVGPMDYTPVTFTDSQHPHITTNAHELALSVLFESGIQHMADRPSGFYDLPEEVREVLGEMPSAWDDIALLDGYPGEKAVIARRSGDKWYIAGINGLDTPATLQFSLDKLGKTGDDSILFCDGDEDRVIKTSTLPQGKTVSVPCRARGGFLAVIE